MDRAKTVLGMPLHILIWFWKRNLIVKLIIFVLILSICWVLVTRIFSAHSTSQQYQTTQVQRGTLIATVSESGNVASSSQAGVGSPTTGIIEELYVKDGDRVTQGQKLFKVKSTATAQEIASAYSSYENAVSQANTAQQNKLLAQASLEKDRQSVIDASTAVTTMQDNLNVSAVNPTTKQTYTQNDIDSITSSLTAAKETFTADEKKYTQSDQSIAAAQAGENSAWLSYEATQDSVVTAPVNGTVANITVKAGDQISATSGSLTSSSSSSSNSSSSSSTNAVLSIGDFSKPYIKVAVNEVDIATVKAGEEATITLSAFSNKTFVGTVDQVDTIGTNASGVVTYNAYISLIGAPSTIKPGMSATVTIETARKDNVLYLPSEAIQTTNGENIVQVIKNGKRTTITVTTGLITDMQTEITSGLSEGETVVSQSASMASNNNTSSAFSSSLSNSSRSRTTTVNSAGGPPGGGF